MTAVATEPVPLLTKLIPVPRLNEVPRAKELREAAMHTEATDYSTEVTVRSLVHHTLLRNGAREAMRVFAEYRNALLTADLIEKGNEDWRYYGGYTGDRRGDAVYDQCTIADACLRILLAGHPEPPVPAPVPVTEKASA